MAYKFFNELQDPLIKGLDDGLMMMLDSARDASGHALARVRYVITSGLRKPGENSILQGAVPDSAHLLGLAVDLAVEDDMAFAAIVIGLVEAGFTRFGLYYTQDVHDPNHFLPRHIHVDIDPSKPSPCIWTKREQN